MFFWQLIRSRYPSREKRLFDDVLGIDAFPTLAFSIIDETFKFAFENIFL
jgi:hypothetical protein